MSGVREYGCQPTLKIWAESPWQDCTRAPVRASLMAMLCLSSLPTDTI
jgi:hypothetical protein